MDDIDVDDMDYALSTVDDQIHQVEGYGNVRYVESDELFKE
jgi:hypothetical protein